MVFCRCGYGHGRIAAGTDQKVYALVGDGEINEGPIWEGALVAAHHGLNNLMLIIDKNGFQAMGTTDEVLALGIWKPSWQVLDLMPVR